MFLLGSLYFYVNFRISLSIFKFTSKLAPILVGIVLKLWKYLRRLHMLTILSRLTMNHSISCLLVNSVLC